MDLAHHVQVSQSSSKGGGGGCGRGLTQIMKASAPTTTHLQFVKVLSIIVRWDNRASQSREPQLTLDHVATTAPLPNASAMAVKRLRAMYASVSAQESKPPSREVGGGVRDSPVATTPTRDTDCKAARTYTRTGICNSKQRAQHSHSRQGEKQSRVKIRECITHRVCCR